MSLPGGPASWEDRMAARAAARRAAEPGPADPHAGHHVHHWGNSSWCSCGTFMGIFSIALPPEADEPGFVLPAEPCGICGVQL
jgi:hypothetical protein